MFTSGIGLKNFFVRILYFFTKQVFKNVEEVLESIIADTERDDECPCNVTGTCRCWVLTPCTVDEKETEEEIDNKETLLLQYWSDALATASDRSKNPA